ncbi:MAG: hypothetical protein WAN81_20940, partial [Candidatus Binataceae bacterium]
MHATAVFPLWRDIPILQGALLAKPDAQAGGAIEVLAHEFRKANCLCRLYGGGVFRGEPLLQEINDFDMKVETANRCTFQDFEGERLARMRGVLPLRFPGLKSLPMAKITKRVVDA